MNRQTLFLFSIFLFSLYNIACAQPKALTILHTNDLHANFLPHEAAWIRSEPKPLVGGLLELQYAIDSVRKTKTNVLTLDAGDDMTGNPISEILEKNAYGGGFIEMLNHMGYEAWTPGNHDLDISQENLRNLIAIAKHPAVNANAVDSAGNHVLNTKPYIILNKDGIRVGLIGLITEELFHVTNTNNLKGLKLLPVIETTQKIIDEIDDQTDLIVAVTHKGVDEDSVLAMNTKGLDIIIGGHSHTRLKTPKFINNVIIAQTGANCENLGVIDLEVENDKVTKYNGELVQLWKHESLPANDLSKLIDEFKSRIEKEYGVEVGSLTEDWKRSNNETSIGYFVADAIRLGGNADLGVTNSSGIRKDLLKGPVTKLNLFEVGPFRNFVCTFSLSGKEVRALIQKHLNALVNNKANLQYAGVHCTYSVNGTEATIEKLSIGDSELDDAKTYTVATTDFLINQADKYLGFIPNASTPTEETMFNAMVSKVTKEKGLTTPAMQFVKAN